MNSVTSRPQKPNSNSFVRCQRCGRLLSNPESQARGYGSICWEIVQQKG
ncbi:MAG: DUF6011 domain-containing protein [Candidatus Heimdallarchaeota archaeon]